MTDNTTDNTTEFYNYLKKIKGLSDRSIYHYFTYHRHFEKMPLTQGSINKFTALKNNNSVCRGYLKSYLEFLKRTKEFDLPIVKSGSTKKRLARPIAQGEIKKIIDHAYSMHIKDGILMDLLYYGALRRSESLSIKVNGFDWGSWFEDPDKYCVLNVIGKRDKERRVVVHPRVVKKLLEIYLAKGILTPQMDVADMIEKLRSMDDPLFKSMTEWNVWKLVKKYAKLSLNRDIRTHELRHARATELETNGASIRDIQRYLGHADQKTTEIYLHSDETKSLDNIKALSETL